MERAGRIYGGILSVIGILAFAAIVIWSRMRRVRAIAKCDDGKTMHFFHYEGDSVGEWTLETAESDACADAPAEPTENLSESAEDSSEEEAE